MDDIRNSAPRSAMSSAPEEKQYSEDLFWSTYLKAAEDEDEHLPRSWEANTGSILTFTGLFAATVAAFIIESYKSLSPDSGDQTVALLARLLDATANSSSQAAMNSTSSTSFSVPTSAVVVNALWFASLLISLVCALLATLIQEWSRNYVRDINRRRTLNESPRNRAFNHIYIRMGVEQYGLDHIVYWITGLVHLAVTLFATGLLVFLYPINKVVAGVAAAILSIVALGYLSASGLPLLDSNCPYRTPVTYVWSSADSLASQLLHLGTLWARLPYMTSLPKGVSNPGGKGSQPTLDCNEFLSAARFSFAWERTGHYIMDGPFDVVLKTLKPVVDFNRIDDVEPWIQFERLRADTDLARKLERLLTRAYYDSHEIDPAVYEAIVLLCELTFTGCSDVQLDSRSNSSAGIYLHALGRLAVISKNHEDVEVRLAASLCLANVRALLIRHHETAPERIPGVRPDTSVPTSEKIADSIPVREGLLDYREVRVNDIRRPGWLSAIMDFQLYNASTPVSFRNVDLFRRWLDTTEPVLKPLHQGDCCKSWRHYAGSGGWFHEAASNILTLISQLLSAPRAVRQTILNLPAASEFLGSWSTEFIKMPIERRPPSTEFIDVLDYTGLHAWLEPGSNFDSLPNRSRPEELYHFLTEIPGMHIIVILRILARNTIDLKAYHESQDALRLTVRLRAGRYSPPDMTSIIRVPTPSDEAHMPYATSLPSTSSFSEDASQPPLQLRMPVLPPFTEWVPPPPSRPGAFAFPQPYGGLHGSDSVYSLVIPSPRTNSPVSSATHDLEDEVGISGAANPSSSTITESEYTWPYRGLMHPNVYADHRPYSLDQPYGPNQPREPYHMNQALYGSQPIIPSPRSSSTLASLDQDRLSEIDGLHLPELLSVTVDRALSHDGGVDVPRCAVPTVGDATIQADGVGASANAVTGNEEEPEIESLISSARSMAPTTSTVHTDPDELNLRSRAGVGQANNGEFLTAQSAEILADTIAGITTATKDGEDRQENAQIGTFGLGTSRV